MDKFLDDQFRRMRVVEVKQRIQTVVVIEELIEGEAQRQEFIAGTIDRAIPVPYEQ